MAQALEIRHGGDHTQACPPLGLRGAFTLQVSAIALTEGSDGAILVSRRPGENMLASSRRVLDEFATERASAAPFPLLADVISHARRVFGGREALAREWLCNPNPALGGDIPLMRAAVEEGAREVDAVLARIEHGIHS